MAGNKQAGAAQAATEQDIALNDDVVRDYLRENHDFLQRHPDMLDYLNISHPTGSAVSLVERQVSVLRERNIDMRHRLKTLTSSGRANDKLFEQSSRMVLQLLAADSTAAIYDIFMTAMTNDFDVEFACMALYRAENDEQDGDCGYRTESRENTNAQIGSLLHSDKPVCGTLRQEEFTFLFPDCHDAGSAALVPLVGEEPLGFIAVGSSDANRYSKNMGTLFLSHIADVVIKLLPRLTERES
ncbi:MAG: hypothetical protein ACI9NT_002389 [Bacteroidia bacterium]|jgi:uncharacterized protein YigA (DUF484 family)